MAAISGLDARPAWAARTGFHAGEASLLAAATLLMLWPAFYNGFPLIFSDTGTYISQAMEFHLGWDRPPYYSFFLLALDWGRTMWPPLIVQCFTTVWLIRRCQRVIFPRAGTLEGAVVLAPLATITSLPWTAAQVMPDIATPILVLAFAILSLDPRIRKWERSGLMLCIGFAILVHLTNLPISVLLCGLTQLPRLRRLGVVPLRVMILPIAIGLAGLIGVNVIASGRVSPSPYGATFVLARLIGNGPARTTLARDCPTFHWALCRYRAHLPATADAFLWARTSPLYRAGGPVRLIGQTDAIIRRTLIDQPGTVLREAAMDFARQLITFAPGSGLRPWRATAGATIRRDFAAPAVATFGASRQARGELTVAPALALLIRGLTILGIIVTAGFVLARLSGLLPGRHDRLFWLCLIVLVSLAGNAAITGALSGPHDRYQSRLVWLAVLTGLLVVRTLGAMMRSRYSAWRSRPISTTA